MDELKTCGIYFTSFDLNMDALKRLGGRGNK